MARRELGPASLAIVQAVQSALLASRDGGTIRVGVSGGADSLALAAGLAHVVRRGDCPTPVEALIVDHGLFAESAQHSEAIRARVSQLGLAASVVRVRVSPQGDGLEAAARAARRRALWLTPSVLGDRVGEVWLAHTADDQAESVLLALARGSGTRSIAGMSPRRADGIDGQPSGQLTGQLVRPLLGLRRATTLGACAEWGLEVWHDPANTDPRFTRSALRHDALPALVSVLGDAVVGGLVRSASLARDDADFLDTLAAEALSESVEGSGLVIEAVTALPEALKSRAVRSWLLDRGAREVTLTHLDAVFTLINEWHGQGPIHLPGLHVRRRGARLIAEPGTPGPRGQRGRSAKSKLMK